MLGNHDYAEPVSVNDKGEYDIQQNTSSGIEKGFKRLFSSIQLAGRTTPRALAVKDHLGLLSALKETPFELLDNRCKTIPVKNGGLNVVGLGEYSLGRCLPKQAFADYAPRFPGLILAHNPDTVSLLQDQPGDLILSGHTHGGQINLPWIWKKLTLIEHPQYKKGLHRVDHKWLYVNRGIGSILQFRWFAPPEMACITLRRAP